MAFEPENILSTLDRCCDACTFPMLDNGYVSLAATRLALYRSAADWAMVIEVVGQSRWSYRRSCLLGGACAENTEKAQVYSLH